MGQDEKTVDKFRKLMGINAGAPHSGPAAVADCSTKPGSSGTLTDGKEGGKLQEKAEEMLQKQQELFESLDHQYEFARMATHTHRGVGLGFASTSMTNFPK